jgi:hydrogenase maturation protease
MTVPAPRTRLASTAPKTSPEVAERVLVAGIGNMFLGDDGFGPEVVRRLAQRGGVPDDVRVTDYGIRGMHLAYDLLEGWDALVLVDTMATDSGPGEVVVLQVGAADLGDSTFDAHGMDPAAMLASLDRLGGTLPPTYVVGCRPADLDEGIGLSAPVAAAVPAAVEAIDTLLRRLSAAPAAETGRR